MVERDGCACVKTNLQYDAALILFQYGIHLVNIIAYKYVHI